MAPARSYLFVPGNRPDRFEKASSSGAHQIIIDLEDAVGPGDKNQARKNVVNWFSNGGDAIVRINGSDTDWFAEDLQALNTCSKAIIMVPKADVSSVELVIKKLPKRPLIALIESVSGFVDARKVAAIDAVTRLAFGNLDFGTDSRISGTGKILNPVRFELAIASRQADLEPPIDGVTIAIQDSTDIVEDINIAKEIGFSAKLCIHPRQVEYVNELFAPSEKEIEWANRIVSAISESLGAAVQVEGKMVDKPMVSRALKILSEVE